MNPENIRNMIVKYHPPAFYFVFETNKYSLLFHLNLKLLLYEILLHNYLGGTRLPLLRTLCLNHCK